MVQPTLGADGPSGLGGSVGPTPGMGRGSQTRAPPPQQQQPKPKLVQKSLAPYNPRMAQSGSGSRGLGTSGWNSNGGKPAAVAGPAGGALVAAAAPSAPPAAEPAAAAVAPGGGAGDPKPAETKATDFNAFLKKGPAPQGMRLPDQLSNAAKKDVERFGSGGPGGQTVPYVRPADRGSVESIVSENPPAARDPNAAAMELIQRNKNQTAKAAAQIPFQQDLRTQAVRPPPQQLNHRQRAEPNRLLSRNVGAGARNGAPDRNRDRDQGTKQLGDRLALARGIEPATRRTAAANGSGALAPSSAAGGATSDPSSAQQDQQQSAPPRQHAQSARDDKFVFQANALAFSYDALRAAEASFAGAPLDQGAALDQDADLDFERLMKEMVRHCAAVLVPFVLVFRESLQRVRR